MCNNLPVLCAYLLGLLERCSRLSVLCHCPSVKSKFASVRCLHLDFSLPLQAACGGLKPDEVKGGAELLGNSLLSMSSISSFPSHHAHCTIVFPLSFFAGLFKP